MIKYSKIPENFRKNKLIKIGYIEEEDKNKINDKIKLDLEYYEKENIKNNYEITPIEIPMGDDLFKLIISKYLSLSSKDFTPEKKEELSIKYQLYTYSSSLVIEMEKPDINTDEYLKIVRQKINKEISDELKSWEQLNDLITKVPRLKDDDIYQEHFCFRRYNVTRKKRKPKDISISLKDKVKNIISSLNPVTYIQNIFNNNENENDDDEKNDILINFILNSLKDKKIDLNEKKKNIKYIIYTQDFIKGFWSYNDLTKLVKEKYEKEYEILKKLNNDKVCMTILIIYVINKDYPEYLDELSLIFKKAKYFIKKETNKTYEQIIKEKGLN